MAGRQLRRQRERALGQLPDDTATELARLVMGRLNDTQILTVLAAAARGGPRAITTMDDARAAITALITDNPNSARLVIGLHPTAPEVERALGITRSPRQQLPTHTRTRA